MGRFILSLAMLDVRRDRLVGPGTQDFLVLVLRLAWRSDRAEVRVCTISHWEVERGNDGDATDADARGGGMEAGRQRHKGCAYLAQTWTTGEVLAPSSWKGSPWVLKVERATGQDGRDEVRCRRWRAIFGP